MKKSEYYFIYIIYPCYKIQFSHEVEPLVYLANFFCCLGLTNQFLIKKIVADHHLDKPDIQHLYQDPQAQRVAAIIGLLILFLALYQCTCG